MGFFWIFRKAQNLTDGKLHFLYYPLRNSVLELEAIKAMFFPYGFSPNYFLELSRQKRLYREADFTWHLLHQMYPHEIIFLTRLETICLISQKSKFLFCIYFIYLPCYGKDNVVKAFCKLSNTLKMSLIIICIQCNYGYLGWKV